MKEKVGKIHAIRERWAQEEIERAERKVLKKQEHDVFVSRLVFWSSVVVIVFANLMGSIILIPILTMLNRLFLDFVVVVLGLVMGFLYNFLILDIGHLGRKHHIWAGIIVPIIAIVNVVMMVVMANQLIGILQIPNVRQDPLIIAGLYGIAFVIPYLVDRLRVLHGRRPLLKSVG